MEFALKSVKVVDEKFLTPWVRLLGHPLIQPKCETLFEIMKNVCLAIFEKPVKWDEIDLLKIFLKANFISESSEIQSAIYNSIEKFVDENNSDSIGFQNPNFGLIPDHLQHQFRYIVMKMNWHVPGEHFTKTLFEVNTQNFIFPDTVQVVSNILQAFSISLKSFRTRLQACPVIISIEQKTFFTTFRPFSKHFPTTWKKVPNNLQTFPSNFTTSCKHCPIF